jgi:hypothetical protein
MIKSESQIESRHIEGAWEDGVGRREFSLMAAAAAVITYFSTGFSLTCSNKNT